MLILATVISIGVFTLLAIALLRRARGSDNRDAPESAMGSALVIGGGVVLPAVVVSLLFILTMRSMDAVTAPEEPADVVVEVIGHQRKKPATLPHICTRSTDTGKGRR